MYPPEDRGRYPFRKPEDGGPGIPGEPRVRVRRNGRPCSVTEESIPKTRPAPGFLLFGKHMTMLADILRCICPDAQHRRAALTAVVLHVLFFGALAWSGAMAPRTLFMPVAGGVSALELAPGEDWILPEEPEDEEAPGEEEESESDADHEELTPEDTDPVPVFEDEFVLPAAPIAERPKTESRPAVAPSSAQKGALLEPRLPTGVAPSYPAISRAKKEEGTVVLRVKVRADGRCLDAAVLTSSGYDRLDKSALQTVRSARFEPARPSGAPAEASTVLRFVFRLES